MPDSVAANNISHTGSTAVSPQAKLRNSEGQRLKKTCCNKNTCKFLFPSPLWKIKCNQINKSDISPQYDIKSLSARNVPASSSIWLQTSPRQSYRLL